MRLCLGWILRSSALGKCTTWNSEPIFPYCFFTDCRPNCKVGICPLLLTVMNCRVWGYCCGMCIISLIAHRSCVCFPTSLCIIALIAHCSCVCFPTSLCPLVVIRLVWRSCEIWSLEKKSHVFMGRTFLVITTANVNASHVRGQRIYLLSYFYWAFRP